MDEPVLDAAEDDATELLPQPKPNRLIPPRELELAAAVDFAEVFDARDG
jgi:hypothetical protein